MRNFLSLIIFTAVSIKLIAVENTYSYLKFKNYSTSEGLSSSTCTNIFQDSDELLWFGTIDGLNSFDGYEFKIFRPSVNNVHSISNNRINSITEDKNKQLWIATNGGLNIYNKLTKKIHRLNIIWNNNTNSSPNYINQVVYDSIQNTIWFSCKQGVGLINNINIDISKLDTISAKLFQINHKYNDKAYYPCILYHSNNLRIIFDDRLLYKYNQTIQNFTLEKQFNLKASSIDFLPAKFIIDKKQNILFGNNLKELHYWIPETDSIIQLALSNNDIPIFNIYQDSKSRIWISTDGYGIYLLDSEFKLIAHIKHNSSIQSSLPNNQPSYVIESADGLFWIASYNKGFSKLDFSQATFGHIATEANNSTALSGEIVQATLVDNQGSIWIGTDGKGLNKYNEHNNTFEHITSKSGGKLSNNKLSSDKILHLMLDSKENIWISTWDGGINKYDKKNKQVTIYKHDKENEYSIGQNTSWFSIEDKFGDIWIGTQNSGINVLKSNEDKFIKYSIGKENCIGLTSNFIFSLYIDKQNRLFVGTDIGLCYTTLPNNPINNNTKLTFIQLPFSELYRHRINYIFQDKLNNTWVGTDLGLHKLDNNLNLTKSYTVEDGLPSNIILGIVQDNSNYLWLTTKNGLSRLDVNANNIQTFNTYDGIQDVEFQSKSISKTKDGRIIVGGINGFNLFNPNQIQIEKRIITPLFTDLKINGISVHPFDTLNNRILLNEDINEVRSITLKHNENQVSFSFVALNYANPQKIKYAYQLEGIDANIIYSKQTRNINYPSLPPGEYTFRINASLDGTWLKENSKAIIIRVKPSLWVSWYAYTLYCLIGICIIGIILKYYSEKNKEKREHAIDNMKLQFFINVSHEFRTPLTLILNPIEQLEQSFNNPTDVQKATQTIKRSAMRLYSLTNQILDLRKIDSGKDEINPEEIDIYKFISQQIDAFNVLAKQKNISLTLNKQENDFFFITDSDKLEKILSNILSNSIKFTNENGLIKIELNLIIANNNSKYLKIKISDNGIGISSEQQTNLFKRFYHPNNNFIGTGIGLNYTKYIIDQLGGNISFKSELNVGTSFEITLPESKNSLSNLKINKSISNYTHEIIKSTEYELLNVSSEANDETNTNTSNNKLRILIIEDNNELRKHIKRELKQTYKIKEAIDGIDGMEQAKTFCPDLIISDVKMPRMNGFELCKTLKNNIDTCHIPIILLTARALDNDKLEGYEIGADSYIIKPFSFKMLHARIKSILNARAALKKRYIESKDLSIGKLATTSLDENFINNIINIIDEHIEDQQFNINLLSYKLNISRSQLARKIEAITGQNTSSFIRTIRLNKAVQLLCTEQYTIKEVAYMVGFNSPAYFSKTFKELYNQTPNEYIDKKKTKQSSKLNSKK